MSVNLKLTDINSNVYNFPEDFWISDDPADTNKNVANAAYAAGGKNIADGFLNSRIITIGGQIRGDTQAEYETNYREFIQAILKGGQLTKSNDVVSRYINVICPDLSTGEEMGQQYKEVTVNFLCEYPFWEDTVQTSEENIVSGNDTLSIDNTGSDFLVFPIIEVEADQGADIPSVMMTQNSDGGMVFNYNNPGFAIGDLLVIDCEKGTVTLNNGSTIEYFNPARFFRLQPGVNTILFEGAACTIRFKFRKVYL
jgi:phage-related protein